MTGETIQKSAATNAATIEQKGATQLHAADWRGTAQLFNKKHDAQEA